VAIDERTAADQITATVLAMRGPAGAEAMPQDFCTIWPQAKPILDFLAGIAAFIPGLGQVAGRVLKGLITVGDQISQQVCKK
jgi:hypothetical protein